MSRIAARPEPWWMRGADVLEASWGGDLPGCRATWAGCWRRLRSWRVPRRWSAADWRDELQALALAAAWEALHAYDPTRGVPLGAFLRQRILSAARTRYRQEWSYALRYGADDPADGPVARPDDPDRSAPGPAALLARLPEPDRRLIEHLFWDGWTEAEAATELGISQQAVSKRKRQILKDLLLCFGGLGGNRD